MAYPYQPPLLNLKTQVKKNLYISYAHLRIGRGTTSSQPHYGHIPPPLSSSSCFFTPLLYSPTLQPWPLQQTPPRFFCLGLLSHLHLIFSIDNSWAHGGLGGGGVRIAIVVVNSECVLDLCFCVKIYSNKKTQASKKSPRALRTNNSSLRKSFHTIPRTHLPWQFDFNPI